MRGSHLRLPATFASGPRALRSLNGKKRVLKALSDASANLRAKLGETLSTVEKFDTPLEQATTPSLEALQAYCLGRKAMFGSDWAAAVPSLCRSCSEPIRLDPNFAMAYASLGASYTSLGKASRTFPLGHF
jgi:eukaryotic-like serine/threonine-protein kinase